MEAAYPYLTGIWGNNLAGSLLFLSLVAHFVLGLVAIYNRPTLRTNVQDLVQILTAIFVVPMMAMHTISIYFLKQSNLDPTYETVIQSMWVSNPTAGLIQVGLLTVVWVHGCSGLLTWLRSKESARNVLFWIYPIIVAIPIAALLGYAEAGRSALAKTAQSAAAQSTGYGSTKDADNYAKASSGGSKKDSDNYAKAPSGGSQKDSDNYAKAPSGGQSQAYGQDSGYGGASQNAPATGYGQTSGYAQTTPDGYGSGYSNDGNSEDTRPKLDLEWVEYVTSQVIWWSIVLAALTFVARFIRIALSPSQDVHLTFDQKKMTTSRSGLSLLDVLRQNDEQHASLCEGRGRCGTCVVRVLSSDFPLPEPSDLELRTLHKKGFPEGTRLACQLWPSGGHVNVEAIFPPDYSFHDEDLDAEIEAPEVQA